MSVASESPSSNSMRAARAKARASGVKRPAVTTNPPSTVVVTAVMPTTTLNATASGHVSAFAKPYVPLEIAIYPVSSAAQTTAWTSQAASPTPVDTYPLVVNQ